MKLNYMQCWNGALEILRDHKEAILAIAGVFVFLPPLIMGQIVGQPSLEGLTDTSEIQAIQLAFFSENWGYFLIANLLVIFGLVTIYVFIAQPASISVSDALSKAAKTVIVFILANILTAIVTILGLFLFVIPGFYVAARLSLVPMFVAGNDDWNPINALEDSWRATKNNGFSILLFLLMVILVAFITIIVAQLVIGLIIGIATGGAGWLLLQNFFGSLFTTVFQILMIGIVASIYRELTGKSTEVGEVFN